MALSDKATFGHQEPIVDKAFRPSSVTTITSFPSSISNRVVDSPIELPDGRLVCSAHKLTVCGKCCVDYSFMDEILEDDDKEESDGDVMLTEEEMKAFRERLIAKKGATFFLQNLSTHH
ncbi:uncharacterized protein Z520_09723 [Fonsecaea multimorphosa CBS 102226]|uniref:Uncharacterized protein n=1 Tax=Fonsecaea multimorphosa CBS 102226 TaxID=1442371 RepID=A0A0D2JMW2_9EURO|nr:uncharacterized protein Z520_09723 [Fonsecaea multimorphosa CBS 102226]KIX94677.1 hypothetical protein Z520_09723 [Fonsecaea multimorphosa CBS 102226]